jgi:hypothetical protein
MPLRKQIRLFAADDIINLERDVNEFLQDIDPNWVDKVFITPRTPQGSHTMLNFEHGR